MSALAGLWSQSGLAQPDERVRAMLSRQAALGSGFAQVRTADGLTAGCDLRRLLPEDRFDTQPIAGGDGRFLLVADVRLDNRADLAAALGLAPGELGTVADSALLLRALLRWDEAALDRLVGDYAFAFFDAARHRLLLARDPLGHRPLFWARTRLGFAFASMPRGLHALKALDRVPDLDSLARFLAFLPERGSATHYRDVQRVEPGHVMVVTPEGEQSRRFWDPTPPELRFASFDEAVEAFRAELDGAVRGRLRGAAPTVGTHLSGGWDSSAVTATAARLLNGQGKLIAFTATPKGSAPSVASSRFADEGRLAAATAALYPNIEHRLVPTSGYSVVDYLDRAVPLFERPPYNPDNHGWLAAIRGEAHASGASVLLTGEIGNWNLSAAPNSLLADFIRQGRLAHWWRESRAMLRDGRARLRGVAATSFGPWLPTPVWKSVLGLASAGTPQMALRPDYRDQLAAEIEDRHFGALARPRDIRLRARTAYREMDFGQYRKGILAGWNIDKRDATADRRLIEFCLALPLDMLLSNGTRRPLARAALADRLPAAVLDERRKGLQAADWYLDLQREKPKIEALIDRIEHHPAAGALIDTDLLWRWVRDWPSGDWHRPDLFARYRVALPFALAAGHFAIHASG